MSRSALVDNLKWFLANWHVTPKWVSPSNSLHNFGCAFNFVQTVSRHFSNPSALAFLQCWRPISESHNSQCLWTQRSFSAIQSGSGKLRRWLSKACRDECTHCKVHNFCLVRIEKKNSYLCHFNRSTLVYFLLWCTQRFQGMNKNGTISNHPIATHMSTQWQIRLCWSACKQSHNRDSSCTHQNGATIFS